MTGAAAPGTVAALAAAARRLLAARADPAAAFAVADLADLLEVPVRHAYEVIRRLVRGGWAEVSRSRAGATPGLWRPVAAPAAAPAAPRRRGGAPAAEAMWAAMRSLCSFSPTVMAHHAAVGEAEVTVAAARTYCRALFAAGYLRVVTKARPGHEAVYRLARKSGLKAPRLTLVRAVVDPNDDSVTVVRGVA